MSNALFLLRQAWRCAQQDGCWLHAQGAPRRARAHRSNTAAWLLLLLLLRLQRLMPSTGPKCHVLGPKAASGRSGPKGVQITVGSSW